MTMIERVARGMYPQYEHGIELGIKDLMHATAKAAIEAMREPTDLMVQAGLHDPSSKMGFVAIPTHIYQAMIDAALKE